MEDCWKSILKDSFLLMIISKDGNVREELLDTVKMTHKAHHSSVHLYV